MLICPAYNELLEFRETRDIDEARSMTEPNDWVVLGIAKGTDGYLFALGRFKSVEMRLPDHFHDLYPGIPYTQRGQMKTMLICPAYNELLEFRETRDIDEACSMTEPNDWVVLGIAKGIDGYLFALGRFKSVEMRLPDHFHSGSDSDLYLGIPYTQR